MRSFIVTLFLIPFCAFAEDELVLVKNGSIFPAGAAASVDQITSNAVAAAATSAAAEATQQAAAQVSEMIAGVSDVVNSLEGVGMIRGYLLNYGVSESAPNTNAAINIVRFDKCVSNDVSYSYSDIYTYFSEAPASFPKIRYSTALREEAVWLEAESVSVVLTNTVVEAIDYECYRNTVRVPVAYTNAFFRVWAEASSGYVGSHFPVQNGIKVGTYEPLTGTWMIGTNRITIVGGTIPR